MRVSWNVGRARSIQQESDFELRALPSTSLQGRPGRRQAVQTRLQPKQ